MRIIPKQLVACTGVAALSAVGLFATAPKAPKPPVSQNHFMGEIETVLALTPAQKDQAQTAFQEARQSARPIRQELTNTNKALETAIRSGNTAQINRLATTEGQEIGQLMAIRSSAFAKVYKTLTPDQKTRADALQRILMQGTRQQMEHSRSRAAS
jgi:Spy/CpxP family protein refolding chaperone